MNILIRKKYEHKINSIKVSVTATFLVKLQGLTFVRKIGMFSKRGFNKYGSSFCGKKIKIKKCTYIQYFSI